MSMFACKECFTAPHLPGCPNAPEPNAAMHCDECHNAIYPGDKYADLNNGKIVCEQCVSDCTSYDILQLLDMGLQEAPLAP
jgi:formylmethanofuran dehydrogenase subunit E